MDEILQEKIHTVLLTVAGLSTANLFYLKADISEKVFPRVIYSLISDVPDYDTSQEFGQMVLQISAFGYFKNEYVGGLKAIAAEIKSKMIISNLGGLTGIQMSRCKRTNYRESELEGIFQIDQDFRINISRVA